MHGYVLWPSAPCLSLRWPPYRSTHEFKAHCLVQRVLVTTLADLALSKGGSWTDSDRGQGLDDLDYVLRKVVRTASNNRGLEEEGNVILDAIMVKLLHLGKGKRALRMITTLL